ncbi:2428_t:CDS:2 [Funneliformis mosseae]|uniref:2428_t:CDS:1 n=1 Tax=Funneliformis mosseae TaxID=27381 RepID=A0A9N8WEB9_FUNMO|nr:2428_t:CDS:2 [Funneliformis mosseae]
MWEISSGHPSFKDKFDNNQDLIIAITCQTRETIIADTPEDYEKLYKNCWKHIPEERPIIKEPKVNTYIITEHINANNSDPNSQVGDSIQINNDELDVKNYE